jgi:hypothetical protein
VVRTGDRHKLRVRPADGPRPSPEDLEDPAKGEKVPRCRSCGLPDQQGNRLLPGLWAYIKFTVQYELCERCVRAAIPDRQALDPIQLDEVA